MLFNVFLPSLVYTVSSFKGNFTAFGIRYNRKINQLLINLFNNNYIYFLEKESQTP